MALVSQATAPLTGGAVAWRRNRRLPFHVHPAIVAGPAAFRSPLRSSGDDRTVSRLCLAGIEYMPPCAVAIP